MCTPWGHSVQAYRSIRRRQVSEILPRHLILPERRSYHKESREYHGVEAQELEHNVAFRQPQRACESIRRSTNDERQVLSILPRRLGLRPRSRPKIHTVFSQTPLERLRANQAPRLRSRACPVLSATDSSFGHCFQVMRGRYIRVAAK